MLVFALAIDLVEWALLTPRTGAVGAVSTPELEADADAAGELLRATSGAVVGEPVAAGAIGGEAVDGVAVAVGADGAGAVTAGAGRAGAAARSTTGAGSADTVEDAVD